ncbi:hypothetical protein IG5_05719, partial [Bacillus toyonensis]
NEKEIFIHAVNNFTIENFNPYKTSLFTGLSGILYFLQRLENSKMNSILYFNY